MNRVISVGHCMQKDRNLSLSTKCFNFPGSRHNDPGSKKCIVGGG